LTWRNGASAQRRRSAALKVAGRMPTKDEAAAVRTEVERFIAPEPREASESYATFARQYWPYISDDPQMAIRQLSSG